MYVIDSCMCAATGHSVNYELYTLYTVVDCCMYCIARLMPTHGFKQKGSHSPPGDEFDIVLLSTVRSLSRGEYHKSVADKRWLGQNLGFITDPHRVCVGLTRAKFGLVIFGELYLISEYCS